jgi:hypothetical protein
VARSDLLPRRTTTLKVPEGLRQLKRLNHNALLLLVESELGVAGQGEVLPQWVSVEAVVGHDAPQIGVADEEDTEHVVDLTLVPVGTVVEACDGGYGRGLVGVGLDANARVVADGEHVVDDLEALVAGRVVDSGDVADLCEFGGGVVFEEGEDGDDAVGRDVDLEGLSVLLLLQCWERTYGQLILPDREPAICVSLCSLEQHFLVGLTAGCIWADMRAGTGRSGAARWRGRRSCRRC